MPVSADYNSKCLPSNCRVSLPKEKIRWQPEYGATVGHMIKTWSKGYEIIADKVYKEILSFMVHDFGEYAWSLRSLDRRLSYFNIHRNDKSVWVEDVKSAVDKKLMRTGRSLAYRAMHLKM